MNTKNKAFRWVNSEFAFLISVAMAVLAFVYSTANKDAPISAFYQFLLATNALFWVKRFKNGEQENELVKIQTRNRNECEEEGEAK